MCLMMPMRERGQLDLCARGGVVCGTCRCIFVLTCNVMACVICYLMRPTCERG